MTKVPGDQPIKDFEVVSKEMNCSKSLLKRLEDISNFGTECESCQSAELLWNKDCRFCGRTYFDGEVWLGMYFDIGGSYTFLLGFYTKQNDFNIEHRLQKEHRQYFYKWYGINDKEEENWLYVKLDNYLLYSCSVTNSQDEIKKLVKTIKNLK